MGPFRMDPRRAARDELKRATNEQVELAAAELAAVHGWPEERRGAAIHGFRKAAKKIRAALDLARDGGDVTTTRLLRHGFREASRALSTARDRDALGAVLVRMARRLPKARRPKVLAQ